jgi:hypothetical protein
MTMSSAFFCLAMAAVPAQTGQDFQSTFPVDKETLGV